MLKHPDKPQTARLPWWTLSIGAAAFCIHVASPTLAEALQMDRVAVSNGAFWQMITGHLTHWNTEHLWADLLVFGVMGYFIEKKSPLSFILLFLLSAIVISLGVLWLQPEISIYRGLSGIDMALAAYWVLDCLHQAIRSHQRHETLLWSVGLAAILCKPIIEIAWGHPIFVQDLGPNVVGLPIPHIAGALVGILFFAPKLLSKQPTVEESIPA
jgi:rhomboid family GlyGly-CTERM serine protease